MEAAGALWRESPGAYLQSHVSENRREVAWVKELFPERKELPRRLRSLRPRSARARSTATASGSPKTSLRAATRPGTAIAHCPTSNFFLGSGCLDLGRTARSDRPVRVGLATDIGGGTSFSILRTMGEAYKAAQREATRSRRGTRSTSRRAASAHALYLDDRIGSIAPGMEADLVVLDLDVDAAHRATG